MTSFYDDQDLEFAVKYASEYSEKHTETEVYDILSELNFTPVVCQEALAKPKTERNLNFYDEKKCKNKNKSKIISN